MPEQDRAPTPVQLLDPLTLLAAIARAQRHRAAPGSAVNAGEIRAHLALSKRSRAARNLREGLAKLSDEGSLERARRHGVPTWSLARSARRRLRRAQLAGEAPALPESPQHRRWREARGVAARREGGFRRELAQALGDGLAILGQAPPADSDAWFELAERLGRAAWRVGSAEHCLREWGEPSDDAADIDSGAASDDEGLAQAERRRRRARRRGRRNLALWDP